MADNQNLQQGFEPLAQADVKGLEMLEQRRNEVLQITNYLEALYARLLTETAGATALTLIADGDAVHPDPGRLGQRIFHSRAAALSVCDGRSLAAGISIPQISIRWYFSTAPKQHGSGSC
ncbi:hypothetical protein AJ87_18305 [Rhizobium yanglingense]|nr:hypothetical protein AJ87_18305 [Rhizobium yanglingense]